MNTVILNGANSNTIQGLMIQSLPFISKPLMRTQVEEIDGRDGDQITDLGFSAYDREMAIGLYGNYDIDDVIRFFNSKGKAIFSNEPDKIYDYQIIEQIDFERLVRFRTAVVVFHVQPFKHSANEPAVVTNQTSVVVTNHGNTISKPKITIYGSGTINLSLDGNQIFVINLGNEGNITIDAEKMEAEKDGTLMNRLVTGNYDNLVFQIGENTLSWTGTVTQVEITNYSRWI